LKYRINFSLNDKSVKNSDYHIDNTYTNSGLFLQDDLSLFDDQLNLILGVRMDKHSEMSEAVFSPRLNMKYEVTTDLNFRLAYTTGFKAPQTFDEDLHIESLGGDQRIVRNSPDLKPEKSRSVTASLDYETFIGDFAVLAGITGFYSRIDDAFSDMEGDPDGDIIVWYHVNSDGAEVSGVELDLGFKPTANSELRLGMTYKQSAYDSKQEIFDGVFSSDFLRTPDLYGYFRASYDVTETLNLFGSVVYTGEMFVPNESTETIVKTDQTFLELDTGLTWAIPVSDHFQTKFGAGVKNIIDAYQDDLGSR
jgi:outer membrane receptor for ferrienterochelin and colicins